MKDFFIEPNASISEALNKLSSIGEKSLIVVNISDRRIMGILSDGDLRKAILKGNDINTKIIKIYKQKPFFLYEDNIDEDRARDSFLKHKIDIIPIVNQNLEVTDCLVWNEFFDKEEKKYFLDLPVMIMAGGKGIRLEPFTKVLPKPLIPINGEPVIEHIIEKFINYGIKDFFMSVNYKSRILKAYFEESKKSYEVHFVKEDKPLGTSGSLKLVKDKINKSLFVTNCDIIIDVNLHNFYSFHKKNKNMISFVASNKKEILPYGICHLDSDGKFSNIKDKHYSNFLVNVGLYLIEPEIIDLIPDNTEYHMTDLINSIKQKGYNVGMFPISDDLWFDIGQWSEYKKTVNKLEV